MRINTIIYYFLSALKDLKRNFKLTMTYIFAIAATIFLSGLLAMFVVMISTTMINIFKTDTHFNFIYIMKFFNNMRFIVLIILPPISIILISYVVKTTIFCRRKDIAIMKYIGATNSFIICPFIIQGIILGFIGSTIGSMILYVPYTLAYNRLTALGFTLSYIDPTSLLNSIVIPCIIGGTIIGALGNLIASKKLAKNS